VHLTLVVKLLLRVCVPITSLWKCLIFLWAPQKRILENIFTSWVGQNLRIIKYNLNLHFSLSKRCLTFLMVLKGYFIYFLWNVFSCSLPVFLLGCWWFPYWFLVALSTLARFLLIVIWVENIFPDCYSFLDIVYGIFWHAEVV
jgi:hypothetical protein